VSESGEGWLSCAVLQRDIRGSSARLSVAFLVTSSHRFANTRRRFQPTGVHLYQR
jgi:hypothetical protein